MLDWNVSTVTHYPIWAVGHDNIVDIQVVCCHCATLIQGRIYVIALLLHMPIRSWGAFWCNIEIRLNRRHIVGLKGGLISIQYNLWNICPTRHLNIFLDTSDSIDCDIILIMWLFYIWEGQFCDLWNFYSCTIVSMWYIPVLYRVFLCLKILKSQSGFQGGYWIWVKEQILCKLHKPSRPT